MCLFTQNTSKTSKKYGSLLETLDLPKLSHGDF